MLNHKRIVVKVGTSTLTHETGQVNLQRIDLLSRTLTDLQNQGHEIVLVSSGAIAVGVCELAFNERPQILKDKQAAAAVGQCRLMHIYDKLFSEYGKTVAQILLTANDVDTPKRRKNLLDTFDSLLRWKVIPIVNENDSVSTDEIEVSTGKSNVLGDNDTLSAIVASLVNADLLVLLTDIDGLYDADPRSNSDAKLIPLVTEITDELRIASGGSGSNRGTGGMATKLSAAEIALKNGFEMVIARGDKPELLYDIVAGKQVGTKFVNTF